MALYCPSCEEEVTSPQPDGMCLTCGDELTSAPNTNTNRQQPQPLTNTDTTHADDAAATAAMSLLASSMENATVINPASLLPLVNQLGGNALLSNVGDNNGNDNNINDLAGILPPEALNPQAGSSKTRPVSQTALDNLKRIVLTPQSAELFDAQICLFEPRSINDLSPCIPNTKPCLTFNAVPAEFGPAIMSNNKKGGEQSKSKQRQPRNAAIVLFSPRTTKGKLSTQTLSEIEFLRQHRMPFIAYVERGDGITFVQKALVCQRAGGPESLCVGVIVGNTTSSNGPWPYVMQDNKKEATTFGLEVPVVMIRREDGKRLEQWVNNTRKDDGNDSGSSSNNNNDLQYTPCQMQIHSKEANSHTCPVCTDSYVAGSTIIRLPCGHVFHEKCALAWLTKHNTCPYCRKEMPTDDEDYERERRRREATNGAGNVSSGHNFYG